MATQQDFYNQLASIYDPQVQSIQAQQALLPAQAEAQTSALEQARTNAFKKIDNTASARGMTFSGFSPDQQATYTGATYLPALANVKLSQNQANLKLIDALNGINANRGTQAMNMYQGQQNALADAEAKRYAAELAYQSKVDSARISSSSKAPAKTSLAEMKAIDSQTLGSKMAAQAGRDGYISPATYAAGKQQWASAGYNASEFDSIFGGLRNPNNKAYSLTDKTTGQSAWGS